MTVVVVGGAAFDPEDDDEQEVSRLQRAKVALRGIAASTSATVAPGDIIDVQGDDGFLRCVSRSNVLGNSNEDKRSLRFFVLYNLRCYCTQGQDDRLKCPAPGEYQFDIRVVSQVPVTLQSFPPRVCSSRNVCAVSSRSK